MDLGHPPRARFTTRPIHLALILIWQSLLLMTVIANAYQPTSDAGALQSNFFYMMALANAFIVSRQSPYIRKFTSRVFNHPAASVICFIATTALTSSSLFRTAIDISPNRWDTITLNYGINHEECIQLMSYVIRIALCVISTIMVHIYSSLREKRTSITITYHMIMLSIGVILYHLWMIEYVYFKWATAQSFSSQFLLSLNIGTYILHAAYQMEYVFTYYQNKQVDVNSSWTLGLNIFFNASMLLHFVFVVATCGFSSCNFCLIVVVCGFEIFHRFQAIYVFGRLLLNHFCAEENSAKHQATGFTENIQFLCTSEANVHESFGLPPTRDDFGPMIAGLMLSPTPIPSHQDFGNQDSDEKCYTATALDDVAP